MSRRSRSSSPSARSCPWAEPHVGAIATQSYANPRYGPDGLALLREGLGADEVVERLTSADDGRDQRQLGVVDARGGSGDVHRSRSATTGQAGAPAPCYAAQGNILVSEETVDALADAFEGSAGRPLAERLLDCLDAAQLAAATGAASSRRRCSSSSETAATQASPTCSSTSVSTTTRSRSPSSAASTACTRRCSARHRAADWVPIDDALRAEIADRLAALGHATSTTGRESRTSRSGSRADDRIDPVVLAALRAAT